MVEYSVSVFRNLNLNFHSCANIEQNMCLALLPIPYFSFYGYVLASSLLTTTVALAELTLFESAARAFLYINYHIQCWLL